jgi:hypothetical protein
MLAAASGQWQGIWFFIIATLVVSELVTIVVAVPAYLVLKRFRTIGLIDCVLAGAVIGLLFGLTGLVLPIGSGYSAGDSGGDTIVNGKLTTHGLFAAVIGAGFDCLRGAAIGFCFWLVAFYSARSSTQAERANSKPHP